MPTVGKATHTIRLLSHNVQGLGSPSKRIKAFTYYRSIGAEIVALQETHFTSQFTPRYLHKDYPMCYLANASEKKRGVALCISKRLSFTETKIIKDKEGRYLLVKGYLGESLVTFLVYYAPNTHQIPFFRSLLETLAPELDGEVILAGDSNLALDLIKDKSNTNSLRSPPKQSRTLAQLIHHYDLVDAWREANPTSKDYSHYSRAHGHYSRIDHIFLGSRLIPKLRSAKILSTPWSDHDPVTVQLSDLTINISKFHW